jgi:hypothetical protein
LANEETNLNVDEGRHLRNEESEIINKKWEPDVTRPRCLQGATSGEQKKHESRQADFTKTRPVGGVTNFIFGSSFIFSFTRRRSQSLRPMPANRAIPVIRQTDATKARQIHSESALHKQSVQSKEFFSFRRRQKLSKVIVIVSPFQF